MPSTLVRVTLGQPPDDHLERSGVCIPLDRAAAMHLHEVHLQSPQVAPLTIDGHEGPLHTSNRHHSGPVEVSEDQVRHDGVSSGGSGCTD